MAWHAETGDLLERLATIRKLRHELLEQCLNIRAMHAARGDCYYCRAGWGENHKPGCPVPVVSVIECALS